jgi:leucyl aminopeptidase
LGAAEKVTSDVIRQSAAAVVKAMAKHEMTRAAMVLPEVKKFGADEVADAVVSGVLLASFDYQECKGTAQKPRDAHKPLHLELVAGAAAGKIKGAFSRAMIVADAQNFARTIANRPANVINPPTLAKIAGELASEAKLKCKVMDEKELARLKMGGILAVGGASIQTPPRMIVLEYKSPKAKAKKPLMVVGKAITFDTGGISIKPADKMGKMIYDKCGGMAVLGLMYAAAKLSLPVHLVGILAAAENAISSRAYRPGDVLRMYNGVTVEVTNTDAEGRLVLGDAMSWGIEKYSPSAVLDLATLTGGVIVALGRTTAGFMSNSDALSKEIQAAADKADEKLWRLPLFPEHREQIKSDLADIVNSAGREAHPLTAGAFLSHFIPDDDSIPWAHLDIAGVADTEKDLPYYSKGATGWGVRTLVNWVTGRSN